MKDDKNVFWFLIGVLTLFVFIILLCVAYNAGAVSVYSDCENYNKSVISSSKTIQCEVIK